MHGRARASEAGFTLIELIVTVAVLGIAFATFVGGMGSAMLAADYHRRQARVEPALRAFAEAVKTGAYTACATTSSYAPLYTAPTGYTRTVTAVKYWDGNSPAAYTTTCPTPDKGLQIVSLRVSSDTGRAAGTVDVLKRQP